MFSDDSIYQRPRITTSHKPTTSKYYHRRQVLEPCLAGIPVGASAAARAFARENSFAAEEALGENPRRCGVVHVMQDLAKQTAGRRQVAMRQGTMIAEGKLIGVSSAEKAKWKNKRRVGTDHHALLALYDVISSC